ncbi:ROK family transcriptional regulator [Latilactobacillus curvatus]|uniref:ROK family transcriptional regulator n=1 Tax=Latilactobacillus curvatus TaxID=28038 RepID=UPI000FECE1EB|nr:ROK family transcriptional regulator [Latilactobacillus curvatus]QAR35757.1 ROK family protein [Latilactobacillus curvatus]
MTESMNKDSMRDLNQKLMLQFLFNRPGTSRIEIANHLKLNKSTISSLYNTLFEQGYIIELGHGMSSETGGRRPILIKFNRNYGYTINFELGHHHLRMMVNWLNGEKITFESIPVIDEPIESIVELMKNRIRKTLIPTASHGLLGISIAVNGIVSNNVILDSPFIDMHNIDLVAELAEFAVPIRLENEANLSAIAARDYLQQSAAYNLIALDIHNGIGAGLIINGYLYRGRNGESGEIGRSILYPDPHSQEFSPIETRFSEDAIISKLGTIKQRPQFDRTDFIQLYRSDDPDAHQLTHEFINAIAFILFNIQQSISPDKIYLQSRIISEIPSLMSLLLERHQSLSNRQPADILLSPMVETSPLYGGASLITHQILGLENYQLNLNI